MDRELEYINETYPRLTHEQRTLYDEVLQSVTRSTPACVLLDAAAGTGKTYKLNALSAGLQSLGHVCICVAITDIAACQLPDGRTAHSMFRLPLKERLVEGCVCDVSVTTAPSCCASAHQSCGMKYHQRIAFVWKRLIAPFMILTCINRPSGEKVILLYGDW